MLSKSIIVALGVAWALTAAAQPAETDHSGADSSATPAKPQGRPSAMGVYRVCKADFKLVCPHTSPGSSKQKACVKENFEKLGPDCQAILKRYDAQPAK